MKRFYLVMALILVCTLALGAQAPAEKAPAAKPAAKAAPEVPKLNQPPGLYAVFETSMGRITTKLFEKEAPKTITNFVALANLSRAQLKQLQAQYREKALRDAVWKTAKLETSTRTAAGYFDGLTFHRVIPRFMIQGGDPTGTGTGGPGYAFEDEIVSSLRFDKPGRLAMANAGPGTNGSQFFITEVPTPWLDGHHTIFGQVVEGQDVANKIANVQRDRSDKPVKPVVIERVTIVRVGEAAPPAGKK